MSKLNTGSDDTSQWSPIIELKILENYTFKVKLENDKAYFVDMKSHFRDTKMDQEIKKTFNDAKIDEFGGLEWPNGWDMCADWIIEYGVLIDDYDKEF